MIIITEKSILSNTNMVKQVHIIVTGIVQGVFFRYNTMKKAQELDVKGWVKNLRDGRVEIVAEGKEENLNTFIEWCKRGPKGAYVEKLDIEWKEYLDGFSDFKIIY